MAVKPTAPRVMSGTFGTLYWDGEPIFEVNSFEAKLKLNRESVTFAGDMMEDSKLTGLAGEFSFKLKKVFSRGQIKIAQAIKAGKDPRSQFIGKISDPDAYGSERVVLNNCWFGDVTLMSFESGKLLEEELSGGFTDYDFPDTVKPR
jgi:hypothetical protein